MDDFILPDPDHAQLFIHPFADVGMKIESGANLSLDQLQPWTAQNKSFYDYPDESYMEHFEEEFKVQAGKAFLIPTPFVLWLVCGSLHGLGTYLQYYQSRLPERTRFVALLDAESDELSQMIEGIRNYFPNCLIFTIPQDGLHPHLSVQMWLFNWLMPEVGKNAWNIVTDVDEFLPLPVQYPNFQTFGQHLHNRGISQLNTYMWDVWNLSKNYQRDEYLEVMGIHSAPNEFNNPHDLHHFADLFITPEGRKAQLFSYFRRTLMGGKPQSVTKTSMVFLDLPTRLNGFRFPTAGHELWFPFRTEAEVRLRYPLLHKKYSFFYPQTIQRYDMKTRGKEKVTEWDEVVFSYLHKKEIEEDAQRAQHDMGFGPYQILRDHHNDTRVFEDFGDKLYPLTSLFQNYQFDWNNPIVTWLTPFISLLPLV